MDNKLGLVWLDCWKLAMESNFMRPTRVADEALDAYIDRFYNLESLAQRKLGKKATEWLYAPNAQLGGLSPIKEKVKAIILLEGMPDERQ